MENDRKVFNDPIHGNITLHPLCVKIIDTLQFQRLRFIKQLGGAYFVYPGAAHNRFEHSIGVCHLAGRLVRALRDQKGEALEDVKITKKEDVEITDVDILCVEVAALCHDLGHGPFSHLFDRRIIPKLLPGKKWEHENASVDMLHYMLETDGELEKAFYDTDKGNLTSDDLKFIGELIAGPTQISDTEKKYMYRGEKKRFLYEIVSNKRNEIDVDKWDYFARDCHMLGIGNNFNHDRCIAFSRVIDVEEEIDGKKQIERQICFRNKEAANLYDMFHTRYLLHNRAYQHKTNKIIEYMIAEALVLANDFITFPGIDGKERKMSEAINDMKAYSLLTDDIIYRILSSTDTDLGESKQIIERVLRRNLYTFVGEKRFAFETFKDTKTADAITAVKDDMTNVTGVSDYTNVIVDIVNMNYGKKDKNPIDFVNFYSKEEPEKAGPIEKDDVSLLLPKDFAEQLVRVYCKDPQSLSDVKKMFANWSENTKQNTEKKTEKDTEQPSKKQKTSAQ